MDGRTNGWMSDWIWIGGGGWLFGCPNPQSSSAAAAAIVINVQYYWLPLFATNRPTFRQNVSKAIHSKLIGENKHTQPFRSRRAEWQAGTPIHDIYLPIRFLLYYYYSKFPIYYLLPYPSGYYHPPVLSSSSSAEEEVAWYHFFVKIEINDEDEQRRL